MIWRMSNRADPFCAAIADRHYNRQKIGAAQFAPPGRCLVLKADEPEGKAFWITSWPFAQYVKHAWAGAWVCSAFRTEGLGPASTMILQAVASTKAYYGTPPQMGIITFVDTKKVKPTIVKSKPTWGWTYMKAGFSYVGKTKSGLLAFQMLADKMPDACNPIDFVEKHKDYACEVNR